MVLLFKLYHQLFSILRQHVLCTVVSFQGHACSLCKKHYQIVKLHGLTKNLNSSLPLGKVAFPGKSWFALLEILFTQLLFDWGSGNEKLLAQIENRLVPDDQTALFSSLSYCIPHTLWELSSLTFFSIVLGYFLFIILFPELLILRMAMLFCIQEDTLNHRIQITKVQG